ncbi:dynamin family protein [Bacillus shivajii]|uniref:dynamin family protein n=1 Tax=Bacillus shivajii TaxID=1983719 RepID=UPI001CF96F0D|nr:dynamin family protein [Bacillus shivajii]UCZ55178.1 dynamin family protein [Bacillus shivajii]
MMTIVKEKLERGNLSYTEEEKARLQLLKDKQKERLFEVAFCGHFSAGKSTILNSLLGAEVLPTSPIPTSANIVKIKNGELGLSVHTKDEGKKCWTGEIPWDQVRNWGMNGLKISDITITANLPFLGNASSILDTPGVDSTDDSHESVTVEQLYSTDAVVYVMDYNHVQSETNLYFLKQLSLEKKPIYLVVNQIDKHNETEIPISIFRNSLKNVLQEWGIEYISIYFTSMKNWEHPLNEFAVFEREMKALLYNSDELIETSQHMLTYGLYNAVNHRLSIEKNEAIEDIKDEMENEGYTLEQLSEKARIVNELEYLNHYDQYIWKNFKKENDKLFNNVTLFPYETTDLAREWIETLKPGYKVGILFSKKKTADEQARRLTRLTENLQDKVKSQLIFHLQGYFQKVDRTTLSNVERFEEAVSEMNYEVSNELLKSHVKTDYTSRDYVYTFTKEMTNLIVQHIKEKAKRIVDIQIEEMDGYVKEKRQSTNKQLEKFHAIEEYEKKLEEVKETYTKESEGIQKVLSTFPSERAYVNLLHSVMKKSFPSNHEQSLSGITLPEEGVIDTTWDNDHTSRVIDFSEEDTLKWVTNVKDSLQSFHQSKVLKTERDQLIERIKRYQDQSFVISLFGAFSAGKSSFANALLGESILPVSPNPTTATVNTVEQSNGNNEHGTVKISLKSVEDLNDEIQAVSHQLDESLSVETLKGWSPNTKNYHSSWEKTYSDYLLTLKESIKKNLNELGTWIVKDLKNLEFYVAQEENACLIKEVNIYYDCELTKKGIILVDTPGVNSIHGRHTNVAFQQMKKSDAIFYLTYYNHAFSKADQYFLQQIGKVNESFEHDKLYFIINASDLANNENELNGVKKHVHDQLLSNGLEKPRIYDVSSKQGLAAKKNKDVASTSFSRFETSFYNETIIELKKLSFDMIVHQLNQFVEKLDDSVRFMKEDEAEQKRQHKILQQTVKEQMLAVQNSSFSYVLRDLIQEYDQMTLYLRERMKFVLNDYFPTAINVATVNGNSKKQLQEQLLGAMKEWKGLGEYFLKQELEASIVRMEAKLKERAYDWVKEESHAVQKELTSYAYYPDLQRIELTGDLHEVDLNVDLLTFKSYIKSKKDFFEQGTIKVLKEQLVQTGVEKASDSIATWSKLFTDVLEDSLKRIEKELKEEMVAAIENELSRSEALMDKNVQASIEKEQKALTEFLNP